MKLKELMKVVNHFQTPFIEINYESGYRSYESGAFRDILANHNPEAEVEQIYLSMRSFYGLPMLVIHIKGDNN